MPTLNLVTDVETYASPAATVDQIAGLWDQGWRRFKLPIAPTPDASIARLQAAREAFPDAWLGIDNNFYSKTAADAIAFGYRLDGLDLGWFEDIVPPGDAAMVAEIRAAIRTPVAMAARITRRPSWPSMPWTCCAWMPPPTGASPGCAGSSRPRRRAG